jgi:3-methyladenine DNA glycosylase/8-oxoguanine DNA glycosylase
LLTALQVAGRLDECSSLDIETTARRLKSLPGIGQWTVAETLQRSHGAADLVSVGDYHVPNTVGYVLAGHVRTDDAGMLALLEPYRGHRQHVVRLVEATGVQAPRYGPRMAPRDNRRI